MAGFVGLAVNEFPVELREGVPFLFGGVFSAAVALTFGFRLGVAAALIAYSGLAAAGDHNGMFASAVLETAVLGIVANRCRNERLPDIIFWVALFGPLLSNVVLFSRSASPTTQWAIVLKAPLNSVLSVALAVALVGAAGIGDRLGIADQFIHLRPLRMHLLSAMLVAGLLPLMALIVLQGTSREQQIIRLAKANLQETVDSMAAETRFYMDRNRDAILSLSGAAEELDAFEPQKIAALLSRFHAIHKGFLTMLATDPKGNILAAHPEYTQIGKRYLDTPRNVAHRDYYREAIRTNQPYISPAFRGQGFGSDPIVAISDTVRRRNAPAAGVVEGSLNLEMLTTISKAHELAKDARVVFVDSAQTIIYASPATGLRALDPLAGHAILKPTESSLELNGEESLGRMKAIPDLNWTVIALYPVSVVLHEMERYYRTMALWTLAIVALSVFIARMVSKAITGPLELVVGLVRRLAENPGKVSLPVIQASAPNEIHELAADFSKTSNHLAQSYRGLEESLDERMRLNEELKRLLAEQKLNARELEMAKDRAEQASAAKTSFLNNISHEIRTPLNGLLGMLSVLIDGGLSKEQQQPAQIAFESANALRCLMTDLLHFAPLDGGETEVENIEFVPGALVDALDIGKRRKAAAKHLNFHLEVDPAARRRYVGDPSKLRQVLEQLIGNAIKFTSEGFVRVSVRVVARSSLEATFRFEVEDSGIGIAPSAISRIFEPFSQADESLTRSHGGTGIGLAVCKKIADSLNARLEVTSMEGKGTLFSLDIRLKSAPVTIALAATKPVERQRVLIVEDNSVNQKVASKLVEKAGYDFDIVANGKIALERVENASYAAILMDCQMPEMDGYQATREIRNREGTCHIPVIAMTAHAMQGDRERCLAAGMDDYLTKPINRDELAATLKRWIAGQGFVQKLQ